MSLTGYWAANMFCDVLSGYIPMLLIIILTKAFGVHFEGISILYLLYPLAIVPFTYNTSFVFKQDTTAQILTLFINFFGGCICSLTVFSL
jgi:ATP-binding cassette subfamily A (ABC1) protein 1